MEFFVNFVFGIGMFANAALFIPQIMLLLKKHHAEDVSLITFLGFCIIQIFTIWHAYYVKDYLLMIGFGISLLTCGATTVLIMYYRLRD